MPAAERPLPAPPKPPKQGGDEWGLPKPHTNCILGQSIQSSEYFPRTAQPELWLLGGSGNFGKGDRDRSISLGKSLGEP